jgi:hypothetical protein
LEREGYWRDARWQGKTGRNAERGTRNSECGDRRIKAEDVLFSLLTLFLLCQLSEMESQVEKHDPAVPRVG